MSERIRLGDMLVGAGLVTSEQVEEALSRQKKTGRRLGETLVALGYVSEPQMTQVLSNQLSVPWVNLYHVDFSRELLELVPATVAEEYSLVPVYVRQLRRHGDTLYVAMDDPLNLDAMQMVADCSGLPVKPMVASPTDIRNAIRVYYLGLPPLEEEAPEPSEDEIEIDDADLEDARAASDRPSRSSSSSSRPRRSAPPEEDTPPSVTPSQPPPPKPSESKFLTLTLLDGTQVRLPSGSEGEKSEEAKTPKRSLTTRDLIHALSARAAGKDLGRVLPDDAWESLLATLLSVLLRKGLIADWEFVDEWKKHRPRRKAKSESDSEDKPPKS